MPDTWSASDWEGFLAEELGYPVRVKLGRSRTVPIRTEALSVSGREGLRVHMHRMFADAPEEVRVALGRWLRSGRRARRACTLLDGWIERRLAEEPAAPARRTRLRPVGQHHDLLALAAPLFRAEFASDFDTHGRDRPALTWGRRGRSRSRRSIRLGSYDVETHVVRIHPVLDQPSVPPWFVRFVLMHEILHAALPPRPGRGRRWVHHGPEFREREATYGDYERALRWEERNLARLIGAARRDSTFHPREEEPLTRGESAFTQGVLFE